MAAGWLVIGGNADYTMQLRRFEKEEMTYEAFAMIISLTSSAAPETVELDGTKVLRYRNTAPTAVSELYGIALTGTDGCLYKLSIFTGETEDYSETAKVWEIAEIIADSVSIVDYSDWPLEE